MSQLQCIDNTWQNCYTGHAFSPEAFIAATLDSTGSLVDSADFTKWTDAIWLNTFQFSTMQYITIQNNNYTNIQNNTIQYNIYSWMVIGSNKLGRNYFHFFNVVFASNWSRYLKPIFNCLCIQNLRTQTIMASRAKSVKPQNIVKNRIFHRFHLDLFKEDSNFELFLSCLAI